MSQRIKFEIKGIPEAVKMLKSLPKSINDKVNYNLNRKAAALVKKELENKAPKGKDAGRRKSRIRDGVRILKGKKAPTLVQIGFIKQLFYLKFLVFGTKKRQNRRGANRGSISKNDFVTPAHDAAVPKVMEFLQNNTLKIINQTLKRYVKRFNSK